MTGGFSAVGAMLIWGLMPLFWSLLHRIPETELVLQRVFWSLVVLVPVIVIKRGTRRYFEAFLNWKEWMVHGLSGILLFANWYAFVWGVINARVVEVSLGYYTLPFFNIFIGWVILRERLSRAQWVAVLLAAAGVGIQVVEYGRLPWVSLVVASSFSVYAFIRKQSPLGPLTGLCVEMTILALPAAGILLWTGILGTGALGKVDAFHHVLLFGTGVLTVIPLLLYTFGARRIRLSTIGILQYIAPSIQFMLGLFYYREPVSRSIFLTFGFIWLALAIYTIDARRKPPVDDAGR